MSNVSYQFEEKGMGIGILPDGTRFLFDGECFGKIKDMNWYRNKRGREEKNVYIVNQKGEMLQSISRTSVTSHYRGIIPLAFLV